MMREYDKKMFLEYADAFDYSEDIKNGSVPYKSDEELKKDMKDNWTLKDFHSMYGFTHKDWESGQEIKPKKEGQVMSEMTDQDKEIKTALIESIQSILDANKLNDYCCQYWLSDKIKEQFKLHEIYD